MQIGKVNNLAFGNAAKAGAAKSASAPKNQGAKKDTVTILGKEVNKKAAIGAGVGAAVVTTLAALAGRGNKLHKLQGEEGHYFKKFFSNVADGFKSFCKKNADGVNEYKALKEAAKNNKGAEAAKEVADEITEQTLKADNAEVKVPADQTQKADNAEVKQPGDQPTEVKPEGQPAEQKPEAGGGSAKINSEADANLIADYNKYQDGIEKYNTELSDDYYETLADTLQTDNLVKPSYNTDMDAVLEYQNSELPKSRVNENVKLEVSDAYSDDEHINIVKEFYKLGAGE